MMDDIILEEENDELQISRVGEDMSRLFSIFLILMLVCVTNSQELLVEEIKGEAIHTNDSVSIGNLDMFHFIHFELGSGVIRFNKKEYDIDEIPAIIKKEKNKLKDKELRIIASIPDDDYHRMLDKIGDTGMQINEVQYRRLSQ